MPYYGKVEVEVRLLRQGHGTDSSGVGGSGFGVEQMTIVELSEQEAEEFAAVHDAPRAGADAKVVGAVRRVLDADRKEQLETRWRDATRDMTAVQMEAALEVLEG